LCASPCVSHSVPLLCANLSRSLALCMCVCVCACVCVCVSSTHRSNAGLPSVGPASPCNAACSNSQITVLVHPDRAGEREGERHTHTQWRKVLAADMTDKDEERQTHRHTSFLRTPKGVVLVTKHESEGRERERETHTHTDTPLSSELQGGGTCDQTQGERDTQTHRHTAFFRARGCTGSSTWLPSAG